MVRRDRTDELRLLVNQNSIAPEARPRMATPGNTQEFLSYAGLVNKNLSSASEMLSKLTQLVKQRNVFDDHSSEIADMTRTVQSQLEVVKGNMVTLDRLKQNAAGGGWGGKKTEADRHTEAVVSSLQTHFKDVGIGFQEVLQERSDSLKMTRDRRQHFSGTTDEAAINAHDGTEDLHGMLQLHMPTSNLEYYKSRVNDVKQVEKSIHELGELFKEFARIVTEQEELILRIDDDTTEALDNVNKGAGELQRYLRSISSNRNLVLKIFAILFAFIMFFGFVIL